MMQDNADSLPTKAAEDEDIKCLRNYEELHKYCVDKQASFVDPEFPHDNKSIGNSKNIKIVWYRPQNIITKDGRTYRWSFKLNPKPSDAVQGSLGDCWLIMAISIVAQRPELLEKVFVTDAFSHCGIYQIRLCIDGLWQTVIVDDFFPCDNKSHMLLFAVGRRNQLWVSLIEKALAKIYGNYDRLDGGKLGEAMALLTGAPYVSIDLDPAASDEIFVRIKDALDSNYLVGAGTGKKGYSEKLFSKLGLQNRHAYLILGTFIHKDKRLIHVRDPHGIQVWKKAYGPKWLRTEPKSLRDSLQPDGKEGGHFWMPFEDFVKYFDNIDIALIGKYKTVIRYPFNVGWNSKKCGCVRVNVTETTSMAVSLFQKSGRFDKQEIVKMQLAIHKEDPEKRGFPGELIHKSECKLINDITAEVTLEPGSYVIYGIAPSESASNLIKPGAIVVHSSTPVQTKILPIVEEALRLSINM